VVEQFLRLSLGRKLVLVASIVLAPVVIAGPVMLVAGAVLEGGQKFGIVVTSWTVAGLVAVLAWKAAK
jgi:hypothetical protein